MGNEEFTIGAVVREPGSTKRNKTGRWRVFRPILNHEKCVNCGLCFMYCPDGCIRPSDDGYVIDYNYCKGCGICESVCPVNAIEIVLEEG